ncbi:MAG: hypothetical protein SF029_16930 [bacterium]|nr:hypothetical protein [bacterium]
MSDGINILELTELPLIMRRILRLALNEAQVAYSTLHKALVECAGDDPIDAAQLNETLEVLCRRRWLTLIETEPEPAYKVNLRRKQGRTLVQGIWEALGVNQETDAPQLRRGGTRKLPEQIWSKLALEGDVLPQAPTNPQESAQTFEARPKRKTGLLAQSLWDTVTADDMPVVPASDNDVTAGTTSGEAGAPSVNPDS